jgi:hypothetical protein
VSAHPFFDFVSKLRDASIAAPTEAQMLAFDAAIAKWKNVTVSGGGTGVVGFITGETPSGAINGINKDYVTATVFVSGSLIVYVNGLRMRSGPDYAVTGSQNFQMVTALITGDTLIIDYRT